MKEGSGSDLTLQLMEKDHSRVVEKDGDVRSNAT
jgi:hypothetical protein